MYCFAAILKRRAISACIHTHTNTHMVYRAFQNKVFNLTKDLRTCLELEVYSQPGHVAPGYEQFGSVKTPFVHEPSGLHAKKTWASYDGKAIDNLCHKLGDEVQIEMQEGIFCSEASLCPSLELKYLSNSKEKLSEAEYNKCCVESQVEQSNWINDLTSSAASAPWKHMSEKMILDRMHSHNPTYTEEEAKEAQQKYISGLADRMDSPFPETEAEQHSWYYKNYITKTWSGLIARPRKS